MAVYTHSDFFRTFAKVNIYLSDGDLAAGGLTGSGAEQLKMILTTLTSLMVFLMIFEITR